MRSRRSTTNLPQQARQAGVASRGKAGSPVVWKLTSPSPLHTDRLGRAIGKALHGGETLALLGPLGAGKTSLVRGIAAGLGAPPSTVSSPTFVFIHEYHGRLPFAHVDLYRVHSIREVESTGLEEYLSGETVTAIEWADKGLSLLPQDRLEIELRHKSVGSRTVQLSSTGLKSTALLADIMRRFARATSHAVTGQLKPPKRKRHASS